METMAMIAHLETARACLLCGDRETALTYLLLALGRARAAGEGYAAGRILTAIQWARLVKVPVQS